jgi:O-antigen ligase
VSNVYLLIAEEMGLIGLGSFLLVMGVFFAYAWRAPCWERWWEVWSITISSTSIFPIRFRSSGYMRP